MKSVAVTLDKERHLVANLNTLHAFKERTGRNVWDCPMWKQGKDMVIGDHVEDIHAMAWAFLSHDDSTLTYEQVGAMLSWDDILPIFQKCLEAFNTNAPESVETPKNALVVPGTG